MKLGIGRLAGWLAAALLAVYHGFQMDTFCPRSSGCTATPFGYANMIFRSSRVLYVLLTWQRATAGVGFLEAGTRTLTMVTCMSGAVFRSLFHSKRRVSDLLKAAAARAARPVLRQRVNGVIRWRWEGGTHRMYFALPFSGLSPMPRVSTLTVGAGAGTGAGA